MVHKQKKEANNIYKKKKTKQLRINVTHTRGGEETYTHFHEKTKSVEKLHQHSETTLESSRGICSGSRFATIRSAAEWQKKKKHTKIVFILRINLEICSLEMGKRDGSMMLQEMKTKRNNYQLFQLLLVADSTSEGN